jgi:lysozyme family protein
MIEKNYNTFIQDREFNNILNNIISLTEAKETWINDRTVEWDFTVDDDDNSSSDKNIKKDKGPFTGVRTGPNTFEWDLTKDPNIGKLDLDKLKSGKKSVSNDLYSFLSKINKSSVKKYFHKFLTMIKKLPKKIRLNLILSYVGIFLSFASIAYLAKPDNSVSEEMIEKNRQAMIEAAILFRRSDFTEAQKGVKKIEAGYSTDKTDPGNYLNGNLKSTFIGTNFGISADILKEYLRRNPTAEDMKKITYDEAIDILRTNFWEKNNIELYSNQSVANLIYDCVVNQGIGGGKQVVNSALRNLGVDIEKSQNPFTESKIRLANTLDQRSLFDEIMKERTIRYENTSNYDRHGRGWMNRLKEFKFEETIIDIEQFY